MRKERLREKWLRPVSVDPQHRVEGDPTQRDHDTHVLQQHDLSGQEGPACGKLGRRRLIVGRRAATRGRDVSIGQNQPIIAATRRRLAGEPGPMQRPVEEIARAVAGEHAARTILPVRRGRQPDDQDTRHGIAETRHRLAPVVVIPIRDA